MDNAETKTNREILAAFKEAGERQRIINTRVGCVLVLTLMPAGSTLDWFVYPDLLWPFFKLRLVCALIATAILAFLFTDYGRKSSKWMGVVVPLLPVVFIAGMIAVKEGFASPYYAGLNLVLLAIGAVLHWALWESIVAVVLVLFIYIGAGLAYGTIPPTNVLFNNFYFISLMDIIVVVGTYFQAKARFREFALRYQLDKQFKQLQEAELQLVQSEKLASLGRMSAGIIHEINNPLNFATTGLYTLRNKTKHVAPEQQDEYKEILAEVEEGVGRVKNIVSDLRMFTHPDTEHLDEVAVADAVKSALRFMSNEFKDKARVVENLPPGLTVRANKNKLIQVVINLVQNSIDAVKDRSAGAEPATIWIEGKIGPDKSSLIVRDNGAGIAPEHLGKIFDPFFTTKDVGEGMGLGLSICYRIVHESGGHISVRTEAGKFCEFTLEFPVKG